MGMSAATPASAAERLQETPCPRCSTRRLIRRVELLERPGWGDGLPLGLLLRLWMTPQPVERRTFLCELCGHHWREYLLAARS